MVTIPDDPIVQRIMRTGYPPWYDYENDEDFSEECDCDVYYGNETKTF